MLLFCERIDDNKYFVRCIHYMPEMLTPEVRAEGIEVDSIPDPAPQENQTYSLYYNPIDKSLWYEYIDIPQPDSEEQPQQ